MLKTQICVTRPQCVNIHNNKHLLSSDRGVTATKHTILKDNNTTAPSNIKLYNLLYSVLEEFGNIRTRQPSLKLQSSLTTYNYSYECTFIDTNLIHNFYIKLSSSTCFERHPLTFRRSVMLTVRVCSLWYSHSLQVAVLCTC